MQKPHDMQQTRKTKVVVAGGGTAGWVTACVLSSQLSSLVDVVLVESDQIGTVGVGEATIPTHQTFHHMIGAKEAEFMKATNATFKLGIMFENWGALGDKYIHSFGKMGKANWMADFHHLWLLARSQGFGGDLDDYSLELQAAEAGKFAKADNFEMSYAYHLDASLYARYLRGLSEKRGVKRIEGRFVDVRQNAETGFIESLVMEDGREISGDLFIDCTGFRAALIEKVMGVGYEDWSHWLPMNSAVAMQTESTGDIPPYTRSIAQAAGWQWRIPLQHRVGNGHVFASDYMSDEEAERILFDTVDGAPITDPRIIRFLTGRREKIWEKNCIALGLSSGFLEPLESTSIHLFQVAATRLVQFFPFDGINPSVVQHYNRISQDEFLSIRDFIILHYHLTSRSDTQFWRDRQALEIPDSLKERIALYEENAIVYQGEADLFRVESWMQVMRGQGLESKGFHHLGHLMAKTRLKEALGGLSSNIRSTVEKLPRHEDFIARYCATETY